MATDPQTSWTDRDFDRLSWHDNHVHGLSVSEGQYGSGELALDLDFILEWTKCDSGHVQFRIAPATLTFHEVTNLKLALDYLSVSASMCPFSIAGIERRLETRDRYTATQWTIAVNWPRGEISFEATGFSQVLRASPILKDQQSLTRTQRQNDA
ncbi:MAG: hypothetical protein E4H03_04175 [Myxococcales bacterium]|nr:MAG: hypothetical protein E4H03_04175 [Myxococcales bacterium]